MNTPDRTPKFGIFGANTPSSMSTGADVASLAGLAEDLGIESLWAAEHIVVPTPTARAISTIPRAKMADEHFPDPFVWLAYVATIVARRDITVSAADTRSVSSPSSSHCR